MTYLQRNTRKPRKSLFVVAGLLALLLFSMWQYDRVSGALFGIASTIARPFWGVQNVASYVAATDLRSKDDLIAENESLTAQVASVQDQKARLVELTQENDELKGILGRKPSNESLTVASVLAKPPQSPYDTLVIDGGAEEGFAAGDMVVADGYIALGTIYDVSATAAKVKLYSTPGETVPVTMGSDNISVSATGQGGGNFLAEIPRDAQVAEGDTVIFPSLDAKVVGEVAKIVVRSSDSFASVYFRLPIDLDELRFVEVVRDPASSVDAKRSGN